MPQKHPIDQRLEQGPRRLLITLAVPPVRPDDDLVQPTLSLNHLWRNGAGLTWQPLGMLTLNGDLVSTRDLRVYPDSSTLGRGSLRRATLPAWAFRVRVEPVAALTTNLSPHAQAHIVAESPLHHLQQLHPVAEPSTPGPRSEPRATAEPSSCLRHSITCGAGRSAPRSIWARLLRQVWGDSSRAGRALAKLRPLDLRSQLSRASTFDLAAFDPGVGYMLGLGGLDQFLNQEGTGAIGTSETRTTAITSGADLPARDHGQHLLRIDYVQPVPAGGRPSHRDFHPAAGMAGGHRPLDSDVSGRPAQSAGGGPRLPDIGRGTRFSLAGTRAAAP